MTVRFVNSRVMEQRPNPRAYFLLKPWAVMPEITPWTWQPTPQKSRRFTPAAWIVQVPVNIHDRLDPRNIFIFWTSIIEDSKHIQAQCEEHCSVAHARLKLITSTSANVLRFGDKVGFTPLAANTSSGVLSEKNSARFSISSIWGILIPTLNIYPFAKKTGKFQISLENPAVFEK